MSDTYIMVNQKVIALIDCDCFFVSCERKRNPQLKGQPVCVISNKEGCAISRSDEAKKLGVKMGEPLFMIKKNHPKAICIVADHEYYQKVSDEVMAILKDFSPYVQIYSVDEAFVDFTGLTKLYKRNYYKLAKYLRQKVLQEADIPVSIGVSLTKTLSKLASDKAKYKDDGIYLISNKKIQKELDKTNIDEIWGIGRRLTLRMKQLGILTALSLVNKPDSYIDKNFGIHGLEMKHELLGEIVSKVTNDEKPPKSIQNTKAFGCFTSDFNFIKNELMQHIHTSCRKLRRYKQKTSQVGVMLRTKDFRVFYTKKELLSPTDFEFEISEIATELLKDIYNSNIIYRSTGIILERLGEEGIEQLSLYNDVTKETKKQKLTQCLDNLEKRFGKNIVKTGFTKNCNN